MGSESATFMISTVAGRKAMCKSFETWEGKS